MSDRITQESSLRTRLTAARLHNRADEGLQQADPSLVTTPTNFEAATGGPSQADILAGQGALSRDTGGLDAATHVFSSQPIQTSALTDADEPAEVEFGLDYYEQRADDFRRRNPGVEPPDYYLEYGDKYAERFASLDNTDLSPEGLEWRDKTLRALQEAMEAKRREDPEGFAELERDPDAFREFAYGTHPDAYVDSGLFDLSAQDISVIAATPDIADVFTSDGIGQTLVTLGKLEPGDLLNIARRTVVQTARDAPGAVATQAERIIDRLRNQDTDWIPSLPVPDINPFN